jgi:predicted cobalt transporter CbtA
MSDTDPEVEATVREKARRLVGWAVLRHLSSLASAIEQEERANARLARRILWVTGTAVTCVVLLLIAASGGPRVALLALLVMLGGIILGAAMIAWTKRRSRMLELERPAFRDESNPPE